MGVTTDWIGQDVSTLGYYGQAGNRRRWTSEPLALVENVVDSFERVTWKFGSSQKRNLILLSAVHRLGHRPQINLSAAEQEVYKSIMHIILYPRKRNSCNIYSSA